MINSVRSYLSQFGRVNKDVLKAIDEVDRMYFINGNGDKEIKKLAYENEAVPIGYKQTISQPSTVARMLSLLELKKSDTVLEIGTGSCWNAALLALLSKKVVTFEIIEQLVDRAKEKISELGIKNIDIRFGDYTKVKEKFDKIIFTAGISKHQEEFLEEFAKQHLNESGILLCPYREGPLIILKKVNGKIQKTTTKEEYMFVPLI